MTFDVGLAPAFATHRVAIFGIYASSCAASANFASFNVESVMVGHALVTLQARHTWLALAFASGIALAVNRAKRMAVAIGTLVVVFTSEEVVLAVLTMRTGRVAFTFSAVASMSSQVVEILVKVALV